MKRRALLLCAVVAASGCDALWHGTGRVYLWNGTLASVTVRLEGRSPEEVTLFASSGRLLDAMVAGAYAMSVGAERQGDDVVVHKDKLTVVNVEGVGCFARADVSGMYRRDVVPVRLLEAYAHPRVIEIDSEVRVLPGEPLPQARPKTAYTFQRLVVVDCKLVGHDSAIERFVQQLP